MIESNKAAGDWAAHRMKDILRLGYWTAAWLLTLAVANFGPTFLWQEAPVLSLLALAVNIGVGAAMILANVRHLRGLDEMQQKITLEAMGVSLGVGLVLGFAYATVDAIELIPFPARISHLLAVMALTYLASLAINRRKYL